MRHPSSRTVGRVDGGWRQGSERCHVPGQQAFGHDRRGLDHGRVSGQSARDLGRAGGGEIGQRGNGDVGRETWPESIVVPALAGERTPYPLHTIGGIGLQAQSDSIWHGTS